MTGQAFSYLHRGVNIDRVVDGKIVKHGGAANMLLPLLEANLIKVVE